jgi:hypothetical protein
MLAKRRVIAISRTNVVASDQKGKRMPLPSPEELGLPIRNPVVSGPGVDMLNRRKEDNNNDRFTVEKYRANFNALKDSVLASLRQIIDEAPRR